MSRYSFPAKSSTHRTSRYYNGSPDANQKRKKASPRSDQDYPRLIYLIELDESVSADAAFMLANPKFIPGMASFYVGSSSLTAQERFDQHKAGHKNSSRIALLFGERLRMDLVPNRGAMLPRSKAIKEEEQMARELRSNGFGAWQH